MTNEYKTTHMTNMDTYKGCEDRTGVINKFVIAVFMFTTIPLLVLAPIFSGAVLAKSSTDKLLKEIIQQQKLQIQLQQDNMGLLLNATHNTTAQLQISNIYLQNAMVESHNQNARLLQGLGK